LNAAPPQLFPCVEQISQGRVPQPCGYKQQGVPVMRGVLMWLVGIPIPIIILLYVFNVV
jgi:hypothetical protein